nr:replication initiation factor domain-containing protein [Oceanococcus sp. HetDA_MAG_MS8]
MKNINCTPCHGVENNEEAIQDAGSPRPLSSCSANLSESVAEDSCDASEAGPFSNTGLNSNPLSAFVDWLAFTLPTDENACDGDSWFEYPTERDQVGAAGVFAGAAVEVVSSVFGVPVSMMPKKGGQLGYLFSYELYARNVCVGVLAVGGASQRGSVYVSITGDGCRILTDDAPLSELAKNLERVCARLSRVDVAVDDHEGKVFNIQSALDALKTDDFVSGRGRKPSARLIDDLGSGDGKTLYVGSRSGGKFCRIYEKGRQLKDPTSPWVRCEIEFKRSTGRELPFELVSNPARYLSGAYAYFSGVSENATPIKTTRIVRQKTYARMVEHARRQCGRSLHAITLLNNGDWSAVQREVVRCELPAGVDTLLVDGKPVDFFAANFEPEPKRQAQ